MKIAGTNRKNALKGQKVVHFLDENISNKNGR